MTKQKWLSYNTQLLYKEDLPEKIGIRDGSPTFFSNPATANTNGSKDEQNIEFSLKQIDNNNNNNNNFIFFTSTQVYLTIQTQ